MRGSLSELAYRFEAGARGEVTIVVEGAPSVAEAPGDEELRQRVRALLAAGGSARDVAAQLARETGAPRRVLYALAVEEARVTRPPLPTLARTIWYWRREQWAAEARRRLTRGGRRPRRAEGTPHLLAAKSALPWLPLPRRAQRVPG